MQGRGDDGCRTQKPAIGIGGKSTGQPPCEKGAGGQDDEAEWFHHGDGFDPRPMRQIEQCPVEQGGGLLPIVGKDIALHRGRIGDARGPA